MFILVNLKAYDCPAVRVAEAAAATASDDIRSGVAPQAVDLPAVVETGVEAWAQHVSPIGSGSHTGSTRPAAVASVGGVGTLLNHSENRLRLADIDGSIRAAADAGLQTIVCANNPEQIGAVAALGPDAVAIEPPELIGTGTPVSQADPAIVEEAVAAAERIDETVDVLCGAGISTGKDVLAARDLGADGVLLASGVAKAEDPAAAIEELIALL